MNLNKYYIKKNPYFFRNIFSSLKKSKINKKQNSGKNFIPYPQNLI